MKVFKMFYPYILDNVIIKKTCTFYGLCTMGINISIVRVFLKTMFNFNTRKFFLKTKKSLKKTPNPLASKSYLTRPQVPC
jgi:hypothetical protein